MIKLNNPLTPNLKKLTSYLSQVNDSGWYTNFGPLHEKLTARLEEYLGVKNLLLVSNGTLAIQVAAKALEINSAITTPFSFVATSSSLLWQGVEIAYSDIDPNSYNLCPKQLDKALESDSHYDSVVATHVYGNPCDVKGIDKIIAKHEKKIIYDAAHAFGVKVGNESILNFGDASTLSFHATKVFHTIEGGAIVFKHRADYEKAKKLINFGIEGEGVLGKPGINAKLNEYQCAVGLTILENIDEIISHRAKLFLLYKKLLRKNVRTPEWHQNATFNGAYFPIYIKNKKIQESIMQALELNNIQSRKYFTPSLDEAYKYQKSFDCRESKKIAGGIICLPLHYYLKIEEVIKISSIINNTLEKK